MLKKSRKWLFGSPKSETASSPEEQLHQETEHLTPAQELKQLKEQHRSLQKKFQQVSLSQKKLKQLNQAYGQLFEHAPVPYLVFNEKGVILEANMLAMELLGLQKKNRGRKNFTAFLDQENKDHFLEHLGFVLDTDEKHQCDLSIRTARGSTLVVELQSLPGDNAGTDTRFVCTLLFDISLRYQMEQELIEEREQAIHKAESMNEFMANMSHEIRTPLAGVIGFADVLVDELPEEHREMAQLISSGGTRLLNTLNSVLDYARLKATEQSSSLHPVDVVHRVHQQVKLLSPLAEQRQLDFTFSCEFDALYCMLDESFLDRIVTNLVSNALKYTEEGGVHITVDTIDNRVRFSVRDTGIGIDETFRPLLFEPFQQQHTDENESADGVGLGLAITKRLVDLMGGTISVESTIGEGSTFEILFPKLKKRSARRAPLLWKNKPPAAKKYDFSKLSVLAIEDNRETRLLIHRLLHTICDVTLVSNYDDALLQARQNNYDIALMDINLGEKRTGLDLLRAFQSEAGPAQDMYKIAFTAYALPSDQARFLAEGFDDYLAKPFTHHALHRTLERAQLAILQDLRLRKQQMQEN